MPKNKVSDPITDQEIAFARLVLSGGMTDRHAAEAVGLDPDSAAYTKSKPRVRAYMLEHRAAVEQQLVQQEVDLSRLAVDGQRRLNLDREQVLTRLWEIANLSPDMTRSSVTGQVKALSMIVAMLDLIPDRRAAFAKKSAPAPIRPQPSPAAAQQEDGQGVPGFVPRSAGEAPPNPIELSSRLPRPPRRAVGRAVGPERSVVEGPAVSPGPTQSTFANRLTPSEAPKPYVPLFGSVPDLGVDFPIKNPFVRPPLSY